MPPSTDRLALAHGACVIVDLRELGELGALRELGEPGKLAPPGEPEAVLAAAIAALPPDEQARALACPPARRRGYVAGRTALHAALTGLGAPAAGVAIGSDDRGAPILPAGWIGSVSHKGAWAAALVAPAGVGRIGIDLERAAPPRLDIAPRILTPRELAALPTDPDARGRAVTLRFSIKEAVYKAIDPYVRRYVGFLEVEVDLDLDLDPGPGSDQVAVITALPFAIEASWREHAGHWLTTARATPR